MDEAMGTRAFESCYEVYYIKEDAMKLLLAGLGQTQWYGLFSGNAKTSAGAQTSRQAHKGDANRILAELYQNGVIDWDGQGAAVRAPYAKMFSAMLEQKSCVTVRSPVQSAPLRCCYLSAADVVVTQKSQREEGTLGIALLPTQGFVHLIEEECLRLEPLERCLFSCRDSQTGQAFQTIAVMRDGLRAYRIRIQFTNGTKASLRWIQEEFAGRFGKLLSATGAGAR